MNPRNLQEQPQREIDSDLIRVQEVLGNIQKRRDESETGQLSITMSEQDYLAWVIREREDLVLRLATEMRETRELMVDIARLVEEQGYFVGTKNLARLDRIAVNQLSDRVFRVDSIEANIELSRAQVEKGKEEIGKAYASKKKSRERGCIAAGAAGVGALILALIVGSAVRPH